MYIFILVVMAVTGLIHWFLYARLVSALDITSPAAIWILRLAAVLLSQSYIITKMLERSSGFSIHALEWLSSVWIAFMWHFLWICLLLTLAKLLLVLTGVWIGFDGGTQVLIGRVTFAAVVGLVLILNGYGYHRAASPARVVEVRVPVEEPSMELQGMRIALAADFHASTIMTANRVANYCDQITALNPDLILIPGDIVDTPAKRILGTVESFRRLKAKRGVFGTTGNHEYYVGLSDALEMFRASGIKILMNQTVELPGGLVISGIEDRTAKSMGAKLPSPDELLRGRQERKVKILLNHTPATPDMEAATKAGADLVVSGHTHGGQIWPFSLLTRWAFQFHHGLYPVGEGHVLTTSGIGFWGPPMRLGAPPEIMMIQFVPKDKKAEVVWG